MIPRIVWSMKEMKGGKKITVATPSNRSAMVAASKFPPVNVNMFVSKKNRITMAAVKRMKNRN